MRTKPHRCSGSHLSGECSKARACSLGSLLLWKGGHMFEAELYPPEWRAMRREKLAQANYRCEACGVEHLAVRQNTRTGTPYLVYLSIAHKQQYETWKKEAETMVLCQRCHRRYDRQFR